MLSVLVQTEFSILKLKIKKYMTASKMLITILQMFKQNKFQQKAINSANVDKIRFMQWNCRGLSKKVLAFSCIFRGKRY